MTGNNCPDCFTLSINEKSSLITGIIFLFFKDQPTTYIINKRAKPIPGIIPAIKSLAIDSSTVTP